MEDQAKYVYQNISHSHLHKVVAHPTISACEKIMGIIVLTCWCIQVLAKWHKRSTISHQSTKIYSWEVPFSKSIGFHDHPVVEQCMSEPCCEQSVERMGRSRKNLQSYIIRWIQSIHFLQMHPILACTNVPTLWGEGCNNISHIMGFYHCQDHQLGSNFQLRGHSFIQIKSNYQEFGHHQLEARIKFLYFFIITFLPVLLYENAHFFNPF